MDEAVHAYNFDESLKEDFQKQHGVTKTDESTVAHELKHQIDYDTGNMKDSYGVKDTETYTSCPSLTPNSCNFFSFSSKKK